MKANGKTQRVSFLVLKESSSNSENLLSFRTCLAFGLIKLPKTTDHARYMEAVGPLSSSESTRPTSWRAEVKPVPLHIPKPVAAHSSRTTPAYTTKQSYAEIIKKTSDIISYADSQPKQLQAQNSAK